MSYSHPSLPFCCFVIIIIFISFSSLFLCIFFFWALRILHDFSAIRLPPLSLSFLFLFVSVLLVFLSACSPQGIDPELKADVVLCLPPSFLSLFSSLSSVCLCFAVSLLAFRTAGHRTRAGSGCCFSSHSATIHWCFLWQSLRVLGC